ncbi:MAG: pantoate--beta-alanine ligase [Chloroflexales bacterium]|nr:pantoate--beta-alanine ligase [Chloroflexales bacterium]
MEVIETIDALRKARARFGQLGLVPTMGYLHEGHLSLVRLARADCTATAASIFVNPTQFSPHEDLSRYPRDLERDLSLLRAEGVDLVFVPSVAEMYPEDFATYVEVGGVTEMLEGAARPVHFRGVATIVCKLFTIIQPDRAYFGQKDAQQTIVVRKMARDLNLPVEVVVGPTVREPDGLAMSSRNAYLTSEQREAAPVLYQALTTTQRRYANGERDGEALRATLRDVLASEPLAEPEYVSAADPLTLRELDIIGSNGVLLSLAVRIGLTRLIDNILIET